MLLSDWHRVKLLVAGGEVSRQVLVVCRDRCRPDHVVLPLSVYLSVFVHC